MAVVVDDLDDTVTRLRRRGAGLLGGVVRYGNAHRLRDLRGPAGVVVTLAERIG
ncbi:hypothetical protein SUDANB146_00266 [Streptomyces sp. enrichment culture]